MLSPEANSNFITLARVVKTQGRNGEVAAEVHSDVPDRFSLGMKLFALGSSGESRRELEVENVWPHKGGLVFKFEGIDSMSDAERLIGAELQVPLQERAVLEEGWNYVSDLVGCSLLDRGHELGVIEDVQSGTGEAPLLSVANGTGIRFDIPFAEAYLEAIDVKSKQIRMILPGGMLEINAPMTAEEKQQQKDEGKKKKKRN